MHIVSKRLHDKYGPVVRMAPNYLDIDYSSLIKTCFDVQGVWEKVTRFSPYFRAFFLLFLFSSDKRMDKVLFFCSVTHTEVSRLNGTLLAEP